MKSFTLLMLGVGIVLLGVILFKTDLTEVWNGLGQLQWWQLVLLFLIYLLGVVTEAGSWLLTLAAIPANCIWLYRTWKVLMVGAALETVTPLGGLGGEPIKALILKRHYGIRYREATASLVLTRTTDVIALVLFITLGWLLMVNADVLSRSYQLTALSSLLLFTASVILFFLAQRHRAFSHTRRWLDQGWLHRYQLSQRVDTALDALHDIENRLVAFYSSQRWRFVCSIGLTFCEWICGAIFTYLALGFLGHPISFAHAVVIESFMLLVRSMLFFVPGDIGTQEGAFVLMCGAITGAPALGLALATLRRAADLLRTLWGFAIGASYSIRDGKLPQARSTSHPVAQDSPAHHTGKHPYQD